MDDLKNYFSDEEIKEVEVFCDGTEAMFVEGEEIICFKILSNLISKKLDIRDVAKSELLTSYAQLKSFYEIFASFGFVNLATYNIIVRKAKRLFMDEIKERK